MPPIRLAIVSSHPIQYNAPLFAKLSTYGDLAVKVFYSWEGISQQLDPEFKRKIEWDIPLLDGYDYCFVHNVSKKPGTSHFFGLDNPTMLNTIDQWKADAVLVYGWAFKTHLAVMRHFFQRIPVFFRGDSTIETGGGTLRQIVRIVILKYIYRHIDFAFFPGQKSKEYFLTAGVPIEKLLFVPHSIDNARFSANSYELEQTAIIERRNLGIPDDATVFLFAGKLVPRKHPIALLKVVKTMLESDPELKAHLIVVGTGPLLDEMQDMAAGVANIHFAGFKNQSEMPIVYRMADVYVLPSSIETWGLAVNEAMASSRPVIVSDHVGCACDLVKSGISGEIFKLPSFDELKKLMTSMVENKNEAEKLRKSAHDFIEDWSVEKAAGKLHTYVIEEVRAYKANIHE